MYLFNRRAVVAPTGGMQDAMDWAVRITAKVNALSEVPVNLWTSVFSPQLGTLSWTTVVEDLSQLEALDAKTIADGGYMSLVAEGSSFTTGQPLDDRLSRLLHIDADGDAASSEYASSVTAVSAPGHAVEAVTTGIEIAQRVKSITGCPTHFGTAITGDYGGVGWIVLYDGIDQMQAAEEALAGDEPFAQYLDAGAAGAYLAGHSVQSAWRKLA